MQFFLDKENKLFNTDKIAEMIHGPCGTCESQIRSSNKNRNNKLKNF